MIDLFSKIHDAALHNKVNHSLRLKLSIMAYLVSNFSVFYVDLKYNIIISVSFNVLQCIIFEQFQLIMHGISQCHFRNI